MHTNFSMPTLKHARTFCTSKTIIFMVVCCFVLHSPTSKKQLFSWCSDSNCCINHALGWQQLRSCLGWWPYVTVRFSHALLLMLVASCDVYSISLLAQCTPFLCQLHFTVAASDTDTLMGLREVSSQKFLQIIALRMRKFCSITGFWDLLGIYFLC